MKPRTGSIIRRILRAFWSINLTTLLLLGACQQPSTDTQPVPAATPASETDALTPTELQRLLGAAQAAIDADHLTYPAEHSAYQIYRDILQYQPDQEDARRGLETLIEIYIARALEALDQQRYASARSMLSRARLIDPNHPSIAPAAQQIQLLASAQRTHLTLTEAMLAGDADQLIESLAPIAQQPLGYRCQFVISAKNDAQGRNLYQQLATAGNQTRPRAQLRIRLPIGIERLCFPL